jgi:hypothetical protein
MKSEAKRLALRLGVFCALLGTYTASGAAVVLFDEGDFLNLVQPGSYTEGFEGFIENDNLGTSLNFSEGGFDYTLSAPGDAGFGFFVGNSPPEGNYLTVFNFEDPITATFTSGNVTAIGGDFFRIQVGGALVPGTFTINLSDGTSQEVTTILGGERAFVGFISSVPITSLVLSETPDIGNQAIALDNFVVGAAVPEPWQGATAVALAALGFAVTRRWSRSRAAGRA